jgi:hypothetical protein|tara:strand:- start:522 stop:728 length:207 start_codon:yes stop_codon:yes gene_type:complete
MATQTSKQIAAGQRRSLKAMNEKLLKMALAWEDLDQYRVTLLTEAADNLADVEAELVEMPEENMTWDA